MPTRGTKRRRRRREEESEEVAEDAKADAVEEKNLEEDENDNRPKKVSVETSASGLDTSSATHSFIHHQHNQQADDLYVEDPDENTIRIMVATDNHVGYAENDVVRGNDSFAALEEVLFLAKFYRCDLVLLAGDLFHENRPSRRTLYKTMDIFRRYCMGPDAIQVQIIKSSAGTAEHSSKSPFTRGFANYEDEFYSVDLPVFSIHGNHDDPSRDGGNSELYAALDLLDVANLLNYFGKQHDSQDIRVDPILLKKGNSQVALYGLSNMRDERLNRMWRGEKLSFTRPAKTSDDNDDSSWFNILALHQNRDYGRGSKNCVKEDMIPDWFDFVCWGHEHECCIEVQESVVGTFRISQPGSSVATSLVAGEAERKRVGLLDIKESNFRLTPIPLTQVRSFVLGTLNLALESRLDPDDPKADMRVSNVMEDKVRVLIHEAREKHGELLDAAQKEGNVLAKYFIDPENHGPPPLKNLVLKEKEVLVRLKVDHTGFPAMNNQRFGAKFVGEIANPTDILLFHRKKTDSVPKKSNIKNVAPIEPSETDEMKIEDLIVEELDMSDKKLQLMDERKISSALDAYVDKQQAQALNEAVSEILQKMQKKLIKSGALSASQVLEPKDREDDNNELEKDSMGTTSRKSKTKRQSKDEASDECEDDNQDDEDFNPRSKSMNRGKSTSSKSAISNSRRKKQTDDDDVDDDDLEVVATSRASRASRSRKTNVSYTEASEDDDDDSMEMDPSPPKKRATKTKNTMNGPLDADSDDEVETSDDSPKKQASRGRGRTTKGKRGGLSRSNNDNNGKSFSQSQLSFTSAKRKHHSSSKASRKNRYDDDSDEKDEFAPSYSRSRPDDDDDDWGTMK